MLTKEVSRGFNPMLNYPTYIYISKKGGERGRFDGGRIKPIPKGYREVIRHLDENTHFTEYLKWIEEEHKAKSDSSFIEHPYGIFIGRWRNARWQDEAKQRGLV